jgi:hypothetical protein
MMDYLPPRNVYSCRVVHGSCILSNRPCWPVCCPYAQHGASGTNVRQVHVNDPRTCCTPVLRRWLIFAGSKRDFF